MRLEGDNGSLDIFCVYLDTGCHLARQRSLKIIRNNARHKDIALTIITGDFNFVENVDDRWNLSGEEYSGENNNNKINADFFKDAFRDTLGFCEWDQPHFTCDAGGARSKIDRMYINQHISYQLDHNCSCNVLEWDLGLSRHRAISFARRTPVRRCVQDKPLQPVMFQRKGWKEEVTARFAELCVQDTIHLSPCRKLVLLKDAIRECSIAGGQYEQGDPSGTDLPPDDELGYIMSCIKAVEKGNAERVNLLRSRCTQIAQLIPAAYTIGERGGICGILRCEAVRLSRQIVAAEIQELSLNPPSDPEDRDKTKSNILKKLKKLSPGESSTINAMCDSQGRVTTSPAEIADILRSHWKGVFSEKRVDTTALQIWMEELFIKDGQGLYLTGLPDGVGRWEIRRKHVAKAVASAANTMPGPDGIPAGAYKGLGWFAIDILHDVAQILCTPGGNSDLQHAYSDRSPAHSHSFNHSLLCCLPKKEAGTDPELGAYYSGENTRPLALVNTDNRLIASSARLAWEPCLESYICKNQQGFLKGRNMLSNVIDIDYHAMTVSLKCDKGAIFFFDFKAAFPSVSHVFLRESLELIGVPPSALAFINALYKNNYCDISYKGNIYDGFGMFCGVRQGCPISPMLFAAAVDVLLRRLQQKIPEGEVRAFADDIGLVVRNWARDCGTAQTIFREFAVMSGLELNISKTVCIPLWPEGIDEVKADPTHQASEWAALKIASDGKYLGFSSGPGKGDSSWDQPLSKYIQRVLRWRGLGAGTQFATAAYNSLALSTLLFIAQLENPPRRVLAGEESGVRRTLGGPGKWYIPQDAFFLKERYGQSKSFGSIEIITQAAQLRTLHSLNTGRRNRSILSDTSIVAMHRRLQSLINDPICLQRVVRWGSWYAGAHVTTLFHNEQRLGRQGLSLGECLSALAGGLPQPWPEEVKAKQKRELQKFVTTAIKNRTRPDPVARIRYKLNLREWLDPKATRPSDIYSAAGLIPGPHEWITRRVSNNLQKLSKLVPPRVCAAVLRFIFNGWCTAGRYQQRGRPNDRCWLGCGSTAHDKVEHYCRCQVMRNVFWTKMHVELHPSRGLACFCLATYEQFDDDTLAISALGVYAVYMSTNFYRLTYAHADLVDSQRAAQHMGQSIIQGCQGHPALTKLLDSRWRSPPIRII
jgi:hypothetical protein